MRIKNIIASLLLSIFCVTGLSFSLPAFADPSVLSDNYNDLVAKGAILNEVSSDGNPVFPLVDLDNPFVDTTGKASSNFIDEMKQKASVIEALGYQFGGFIYTKAPNEIRHVANEFGRKFGVGNSQTDNGIVLAIALGQQGKVSGLAPQTFLTVGEGIQGIFPDIAIYHLYTDVYTPTLLQTGSWEQAHIAMMESLIASLKGEGAYSSEPIELGTTASIIVLVVFSLFMLSIFVFIFGGIFNKDDFYPSDLGISNSITKPSKGSDWTFTSSISKPKTSTKRTSSSSKRKSTSSLSKTRSSNTSSKNRSFGGGTFNDGGYGN